MDWKSKPYWFKGGVIGLIIPAIFILLTLFIEPPPSTNSSNYFGLILIEIIFLGSLFFIIGTIVGWIVGKFKQ